MPSCSAVVVSPRRPRAAPQHVGEVVARQVVGRAARQVQHQPRVEPTRPGAHDQAVERRRAHRGPDAAAVPHRAQRRARPEVRDEDSAGVGHERGDAAGGPRVGEPVEAADRQALAQRRGQGRRAGLGRQRGVEGRVEAGHLGRVGQRLAAAAHRVQRRRLVQRHEVRQRAELVEDLVVDDDGLRPVAAVHHAVTDRVDTRRRPFQGGEQPVEVVVLALDGPPGAVGVVLVGVEPPQQRQLQRRRAGVDDEDPHRRRRQPADRPAPEYTPQVQSRTSGRSSPVPTGVGPGREAAVDHPLAQVGRPAAEPRHPVDHVGDQPEPVDVVEHAHVEGRGRRALLLVAADMDVGVVRPAVREPVDQPGVAVEVEDHRTVAGEQPVELRVGQAVRVLGLRLQPHEVDDVDHADPQVRQLGAQQGPPRPGPPTSARRRRRPGRRRGRPRRCRCSPTSTRPARGVQCSAASSGPRTSRTGCLPATTTLT